MKIEFYSTFPKTEVYNDEKYFGFALNVLPQFAISNCNIDLHWIFWGIQIKFD